MGALLIPLYAGNWCILLKYQLLIIHQFYIAVDTENHFGNFSFAISKGAQFEIQVTSLNKNNTLQHSDRAGSKPLSYIHTGYNLRIFQPACPYSNLHFYKILRFLAKTIIYSNKIPKVPTCTALSSCTFINFQDFANLHFYSNLQYYSED